MKLKLAVFLIVAALAVPAAAQTSTSGVVVSSTTETLVVRMDDGTQRTFNVTSTTTLPTGRLAEGSRVTVQYRPIDGGLFEAARVELAAAVTPDRPMATATPDRTQPIDRSQPVDRTQPMDRTQNPDRPMTSDTTANRPDAENRETLPATASPLPLLALSGGIALLAGALLKAARRNS